MGNVVKVTGLENIEHERKIRDMIPGEIGYTVPWVFSNGQLNEDFTVSQKGGTASLRVKCVQAHEYEIHFEKPIYAKTLYWGTQS